MEALGNSSRPNMRIELSRSHSTDCLGDCLMEIHTYIHTYMDFIILETVAQCERDDSLLSYHLVD